MLPQMRDGAGRQSIQADGPRHRKPADPLGAVANFQQIAGPFRVRRYNLFPAAEVQGATLPGFSTGQALGTAAFFGMLGVAVFGLVFTPVFYVLVR